MSGGEWRDLVAGNGALKGGWQVWVAGMCCEELGGAFGRRECFAEGWVGRSGG